jgi:hypothetical protein
MSSDKKQWTLDLIEKLQESGIGEPQRLSGIKFALENDRPIYDSDRQYLKDKYKILQQQKPNTTTQTESENIPENIESKTSEPSEDDYSLMILKNRLAKGDISPQEFDVLKKKVLETSSVGNMKPIKKETTIRRPKLVDPDARYCAYCERSVHPERDFSVAALVILLFLGIIPGIIYYFLKSPTCPICKHNQWTIPPDDDSD